MEGGLRDDFLSALGALVADRSLVGLIDIKAGGLRRLDRRKAWAFDGVVVVDLDEACDLKLSLIGDAGPRHGLHGLVALFFDL